MGGPERIWEGERGPTAFLLDQPGRLLFLESRGDFGGKADPEPWAVPMGRVGSMEARPFQLQLKEPQARCWSTEEGKHSASALLGVLPGSPNEPRGQTRPLMKTLQQKERRRWLL